MQRGQTGNNTCLSFSILSNKVTTQIKSNSWIEQNHILCSQSSNFSSQSHDKFYLSTFVVSHEMDLRGQLNANLA